MRSTVLKHTSWASLFVAFVLCVALLSYADSLAENLNAASRLAVSDDGLLGAESSLLVKELEPSPKINQVLVSMLTTGEGVSVPYFAASVLAMALVLF